MPHNPCCACSHWHANRNKHEIRTHLLTHHSSSQALLEELERNLQRLVLDHVNRFVRPFLAPAMEMLNVRAYTHTHARTHTHTRTHMSMQVFLCNIIG